MVIYKRLRLLLLVAGMVSFQSMVQAVGLGSIEVRSHLNELLDAVIPLSVEDDLAFKNTFVALADIGDFKRAGLDYGADLGKLRFAVERDAGGAAIVHVTSSTPIREPYVSFLVALTYPNGKVLREYTLLLDPPVYEPVHTAPTRTASTYETPVAPRREVPQQENRPQSAPEATPEAQPERYQEPAAETGYEEPSAGIDGGSYRVHAGDTLYAIAMQSRGSRDVSVNQMMMALFRSNPDAFFRDNINNLKEGVELVIPDTGEVIALDRDEVNQAIRSQNRLWQAYRRSAAETTVMVDQAGRQDVDSDRGESVSPRRSSNRLALLPAENEGQGSGSGEGEALQQDLARAEEELSSMKQANADLNDRVRDLEGVTDSQKDLLSLKDAEIARLQAQLAEQRAQQELADDGRVDSDTTLVDADEGAVDGSGQTTPVMENGQADDGTVDENDAAVEEDAGNSQDALDEAALADDDQAGEETQGTENGDAETEEIPSVTSEGSDESGISNSSLLIGGAILLLLLAGGVYYLRQRKVAEGGPFAPETLVSDEVALLAAVEEYPDDSGRRLALLRHYHAQGDAVEFVAQANLLKEHIPTEDDPIWGEVLAMGVEVAPEDELFATVAPAAVADDVAADSANLEDTEDLSASAGADDRWSSLSGMAGNADESDESDESDVAQSTNEPTEEKEVDWEDLPEEFDFDALDDLEGSISPEAAGVQDQNAEAGGISSGAAEDGRDSAVDLAEDETLEFTLDEGDPGLDLAENDKGDDNAPAMDEGIDFEGNLDGNEPADHDTLDELEAIGDSLDAGLDIVLDSQADGADPDVPFDAGDAMETPSDENDDRPVEESADAVDVELGDENLFAAEDAVETKLSLAEAYLDMGDNDGAQSMLDEIMEEGSSAQKDRAKTLLERL